MWKSLPQCRQHKRQLQIVHQCCQRHRHRPSGPHRTRNVSSCPPGISLLPVYDIYIESYLEKHNKIFGHIFYSVYSPTNEQTWESCTRLPFAVSHEFSARTLTTLDPLHSGIPGCRVELYARVRLTLLEPRSLVRSCPTMSVRLSPDEC